MLVEFRVKNFRSLRDEQVLSLVASRDKTLGDTHTLSTDLVAVPNLVSSAVIYGPNASGKSNLIKALQSMRGMVLGSAGLPPGQIFAVQPFRLDAESSKQPTEFEVTFILDKVRYQYGFAMTQQRIVKEYLLVYKAFKPQRWFERYFDEESDKDVYKFGAGIKGQKNVWERTTRPDALFLSIAVQLNSESLRAVFDWFAHDLVIFNEASPLGPQFTLQMLKEEDGRRRVCDILNAADTSIADIEVVTQKVPAQTWHLDVKTGKTEARKGELEQNQLKFSHLTDSGEVVVFELYDESGGTRNLLFLAGPVLDILGKGRTLIVDELDNSLHTHLVQALVRLFHGTKTNTRGAQLIFTTHDTALLKAYGLLRRDQIWFVEKKADQSSSLYSLLEFSPRKDEDLEKGYLQGRYGAIPMIDDLIEALH